MENHPVERMEWGGGSAGKAGNLWDFGRERRVRPVSRVSCEWRYRKEGFRPLTIAALHMKRLSEAWVT